MRLFAWSGLSGGAFDHSPPRPPWSSCSNWAKAVLARWPKPPSSCFFFYTKNFIFAKYLYSVELQIATSGFCGEKWQQDLAMSFWRCQHGRE